MDDRDSPVSLWGPGELALRFFVPRYACGSHGGQEELDCPVLGTSAGETRWVRLFIPLPQHQWLARTVTEKTGRRAIHQLVGHWPFKNIPACFPLSGCLACREGLRLGAQNVRVQL